MRIFYTVSYYGKDRFQKYYDLVLDAIRQQPVDVISPELGNYRSILTKTELKTLKDQNRIHYAAIKKGIEVADAVIMEITHQDFQLGWEANLAVQAKKPLLCLSTTEDFSSKISHRYFSAAHYTEYSIDNLVEDFIKKAAKNRLNQRFNFFLSPTQLNYVKKQAALEGKTTAQIIRDLIDQSRL